MNTRRWASILTVVAGIACGGGSGDGTGPVEPDPGLVNLVISTPNADDGALLVRIAGGAVSGIAGAGYEVATTTPGPTGVTILVRGSLATGVVAQLSLPDRHRLSDYSAVVIQAAARAPSYRQQSLPGYSAALQIP